MIDRELLELAAKAACIGPILCYETARNCLHIGTRTKYKLWRPFTDGGDVLRLAVKLGIRIEPEPRWNMTMASHPAFIETANEHYEDGMGSMGATCRAIVRVAAAIGEEMP